MTSDDAANRSRSTAGAAAAPVQERRFWLEYGGRELELGAGTFVVGRSGACHLVLDDALVSRRHAELTVTSTTVSVRDLGSSNGVFVNEKRIQDIREIQAGDRIVIGKQELLLRAGSHRPLPEPGRHHRFMAETLAGIEPPDLPEDPSLAVVEEPGSTHQGDALELLGSVADKVLALGRGAEAERVLLGCLNGIMEAARAGVLTPAAAERAALYAVKLAGATGKSRWIDYAFELYRTLRRPLPAASVDMLYSVLRSVSGVSLQGVRDYVAVLRSVQRHFGPSERFLLQRIEGLERLAALK